MSEQQPYPKRLRVLVVPGNEVLTAVYGLRSTRYRLSGCSCLPEGFRVISVSGGWGTSPPAVLFLVEHPSFSEVPFGAEVPRLLCTCKLNLVEVDPKPDHLRC
jgi:hypothetical protein